MSKTDNILFTVLQVFAWIIFVALSIEAGGLIVNFVFSIFNPDMLPKLYNKLDLTGIFNQSSAAYYGLYSFILIISLLKAVLFYEVIKLTQTLKLDHPFTLAVARQISTISYFTLSIGLLSYIGRQFAKQVERSVFSTGSLDVFWNDSQAFVLMAAIIYVISAIFKRGVELQDEHDLTV